MKNVHPAVFGATVLSKEQSQDTDLGILNGFMGIWESQPDSGTGWNIIAVPDTTQGPTNQGFVLEVIPYHETWSFTPAVVAGNRGPQGEQTMLGLLYEQRIISDCTTNFCAERGFAKGVELHAESGMLLNISDFNQGYDIARLGTIPHGNSILLLGESIIANGSFQFPAVSALPTLTDGSPAPPGYGEAQYDHNQFPDFPQTTPNDFLAQTLDGQTLGKVTTLPLSSENATGGVLNTPFITANVNVPKMTCDFWLEEILDSNGNVTKTQLQYSQTIDIVFPPTTDPTGPAFIWPHIDINTLQFAGN